MKNHVVSLELAKQLKKAGYPQESEFSWTCRPNWEIVHERDMMNPQFTIATPPVAAPLATELLEQLPRSIEIYNEIMYLFVFPRHEEKTWVTAYVKEHMHKQDPWESYF